MREYITRNTVLDVIAERIFQHTPLISGTGIIICAALLLLNSCAKQSFRVHTPSTTALQA